MDLQDSHDANLRLLFAEGFRCEAAILRGRGARLSSLRSPDLRLGLQEQSLCRRRRLHSWVTPSIRHKSWDESPRLCSSIFRRNPHLLSANLSQDIPNWNRLLLNPSFPRLVALTARCHWADPANALGGRPAAPRMRGGAGPFAIAGRAATPEEGHGSRRSSTVVICLW